MSQRKSSAMSSSSSAATTHKVTTVVCPEVALPSDLKRSFKHREMGGNVFSRPISSSSSSSVSTYKGKNHWDKETRKLTSNEQFKAKKEELQGIMGNIKEYNAHATLGKSRRQYEEERLVALGVMPKKQDKMPLRIHLRIEKVQKVRAVKRNEELKQSDEVIASSQKKVVGKRKLQQQQEKDQKKKKFKKY